MNVNARNMLPSSVVAALLPDRLLDLLAAAGQELGGELHLVGGAVRDLLLGQSPVDLDLTVSSQPRRWAERLRQLAGGSLVELDPNEEVFRVVVRPGLELDFSPFRNGSATIEDDLRQRDLTINALAVPLHELLLAPGRAELPVLDPTGGLADLARQRIRSASEASFVDDPLRMLRVFRFAAKLGFTPTEDTLRQVRQHCRLTSQPSKERVAGELDLIMASGRAHAAFVGMLECGLLAEILPELQAGAGMAQPASHHLDVLGHCLETLRQMELTLADPSGRFPDSDWVIVQYLEAPRRRVHLAWAALMHDVGKPATFGRNEEKNGRITFYNHDLRGADIFVKVSKRLRRSREDGETTSRLIAGHMRPFFLANDQRQDKLTLKACLRLIKAAGEHLPGLFLLAMADALAGKGEGSPKDIEAEVAGLFGHLHRIQQEHVAPVQAAPPLITGNDLAGELHLEPGPLFRVILDKIEEARMERVIATREEALALAALEAGIRQP